MSVQEELDAIRKEHEAATGCPNWPEHTLAPTGYLNWHAWADEMSKTHRQRRCPGCARWKIWEPKP